jgi:hypothetical protein
MRILVCGGRKYEDTDHVYQVLAEYCRGPVTLIHGAALGADALAVKAAQKLGYPTEGYPADWQLHGKVAGPIRNAAMIDSGVDLVIAFAGGSGTRDTVKRAEKAKIPVRHES